MATNNSSDFLSKIIPNYGNQASKTSSIIDNLLNGTPSSDTVRNAGANFGAQNGLGVGSGATNRFGYDLYNQMGQRNQQTGIQDLLSMIQGVSSPVLANQGQNLQNNQFNAQLAQNADQFNRSQQTHENYQLGALLAQLSAGGNGSNEYVGPAQFGN